MKLLVTLGPCLWTAPYGDIAVVDWNTKQIIDRFRYDFQYHESSHKGVCGGSWHGGRLLLTTEVEVLRFDVAPLRFVDGCTNRFFNDLHHVAATEDRIWVCNTGLDSIEELDVDLQHVQSHDLVGRFGRRPKLMMDLTSRAVQKTWYRMRRKNDLYTHLTVRPWFPNTRKILRPGKYHRSRSEFRHCDLRPHVLHANHVLPMGDDLWVTLWQTGEIASFKQREILAEDLGNPHDGIPFGDRFYVTDCRDNRLIVREFDPGGPRIGKCVGQRILTNRRYEAFVRGVAVSEELLFVGFTARRGAPEEFQLARIVALDRQTLDLVDQWSVPRELGTMVFSVLDANAAYG